MEMDNLALTAVQFRYGGSSTNQALCNGGLEIGPEIVHSRTVAEEGGLASRSAGRGTTSLSR